MAMELHCDICGAKMTDESFGIIGFVTKPVKGIGSCALNYEYHVRKNDTSLSHDLCPVCYYRITNYISNMNVTFE